MNALGRDVLRAAGLAGVPQIVGRMRDSYGGRCGLGVLHDAAGDNILLACDIFNSVACPLCEKPMTEYVLVGHLNDIHHADFFKIASLMPVTDDAAL